MATVNLGSIKFKWKGTYAGGTAYTIDDVVSYNGSSYICIQASTGNLPTDTAYFEQMSQKGTDGTNGTDGTDVGTVITTQGDILYRDGSGLQKLGAGTSGQLLQTNGTGANPSWVTADAGKTLQLSNAKQSTRVSLPSTSAKTSLMSGTHTQVKANTKLLVHYRFPFWAEASGSSRVYFDFDGTTHYDAWSWDYSQFSVNTNTWSGHFVVDASSSTGSKNWVIGWHSNSTNSQPASLFCPNSSDDARLGQTVAEVTIQELDF